MIIRLQVRWYRVRKSFWYNSNCVHGFFKYRDAVFHGYGCNLPWFGASIGWDVRHSDQD